MLFFHYVYQSWLRDRIFRGKGSGFFIWGLIELYRKSRNPGIGIGIFLNPRDSGFFRVSGFLSPWFWIFLAAGFGIFHNFENLSPGFPQNPRDSRFYTFRYIFFIQLNRDFLLIWTTCIFLNQLKSGLFLKKT